MPTFLESIEIIAGVESSDDRRSTTTNHYTDALGIRFVNGFPEKIGGWSGISFNNSNSINGKARSIYSYKLDGLTRYLIGTNTRLYDLLGSDLTNITPVKTGTVAVANSLATYYATLANNPITTVSGSSTITIADAAHKFRTGDTVTLSGSSAVNGIPAGDINTDHFVRSVSTNSYTVIVATAATSSGTGGGAAVVRSSGYITVTSAAHGLSDGDRVKVLGAADTGGIVAAEINLEHIIRNITAGTFDIYTTGTATSSVSGGGGAGTTYQEPIDSGAADTSVGHGYGMGLYGVGLYGTSKQSSGSATLPRRWSHDKFGDLTVSTAGNGTGLYSWDGDTAEAPVLVSNAPTTVNYTFVSNDIVVVLGYDTGQTAANENGISWSDQGGITNWTTGQSGGDTIEGAGRLISHASARGENLLFTENQTYTFRYIGGELIWQIRLLDQNIGIIAQNARVSASGIVFWMGEHNFFMWRGGNVEVIPSNSSAECTILSHVFDDLNYSQKEKIFAQYSPEHREVSFHYPSENSNEPDRIARVNIDTFVWVNDEMDRTAAEYPSIHDQKPYMTDHDSNLYIHEVGMNANGSALPWSITLNFAYLGTRNRHVSALIPDHTITGNVSVNAKTRDYPLSSNKFDKNFTITSTTDRIASDVNGRFFQISLSGEEIDQQFKCGRWFMETKESSPK